MISYYELRGVLLNSGVNPMRSMIMDAEYVTPVRGWLEHAFSYSFERNLSALGLLEWAPEVWDCDKFARLAWVFASVDLAKTAGRPNAGLAFGVFCYTIFNNGGGHAINFAITEEKELVFYEPQTRKIVNLSNEEAQSCFSYIV